MAVRCLRIPQPPIMARAFIASAYPDRMQDTYQLRTMPDMSPLAAKSRRIHLREIPAAMVIWLFVVAGLRGALPPDFPGVTVTAYDSSSVAAGYVFLEMTLASTNANRYLMMLDNTGAPVWYLGVTNGINDFKVLPNGYLHYASAYHDHSWTDGGDSLHQVLDDNFNPFETITAGNSYAADSHDFQLLPNGHVLAVGYYQSRMDMSKYVAGGYPNAQVGGAVIQELDAARNVVFQWRSWDHVGVSDYFPPGMFTNPAVLMPVINAFNFNSVRMDDAGDLLVSNSGLDVWKISRQTGGILWRLGGPAN